MPKLTQRERRLRKTTPGCECGICLDAIKPKDQLRLPCDHVYHANCICKWGNRKHQTVSLMLYTRLKVNEK